MQSEQPHGDTAGIVDMSMITATTWVPRGHAAAFPTRYVFDEDEYTRISKLAKLELRDAREDLENARRAMGANGGAGTERDSDDDDSEAEANTGGVAVNGDAEDDDLKEYDMDNYDDEPEDADEGRETGANDSIFGNIKGLAYYADNNEDPYITLPENGNVSDEEEREELQILASDNLVLAARIEDEVAHLEAYVYEDEADNLYVHHDVMLPAMPLCVEWISVRPRSTTEHGNFVAVGTMDPEIEVWDLDVVDGMYPTTILGQASQVGADATPSSVTTKKKKKKTKKANDAHHVDSVLALAANRAHSNLLASASADKTIKLWDLNSCTAAQSYAHHTDKVCALSWHPTQSFLLLSGSYDRTIVATDMRAPGSTAPRWGVESDVEQVRWDPHNDQQFYVSTESGVLHCFDTRSIPSAPERSKATWRLQAHDSPLSSFSINPAISGFIATGSSDRTIKLWNVSEDSKGPSMVVSRDLDVGKVFSVNFAPDNEVAFRLAAAGSKGALQVWDTSTNRAVREAFATRVKLPAEREERLIGLEADDEEEDDEDDVEGAEGEQDDERDGDDANGEDGWEDMQED